MHRKIAAMLATLLLLAAPAHAGVEVKTVRLADGVEAWYAPSSAVPVVDILLSFEGAGAAGDPAGKGGRAAFAAAMLTEGAGSYTAQAFARALDENAITMDIRADQDRLSVHLYFLREHAAKAGELLALALGQPTLAEADIARVKAQQASLLSQLSERPSYKAGRLLAMRAFKGHPYANAVYGTPASVAALGAQDVRDYLASQLARQGLIVSAAGDIDGPLLSDILRPTIAALKDTRSPATVPDAPMQGAGETLRETQEVPQTVVVFAAPGLRRDDPDFYTAYLLNEILGGGTLTSRLGNEVRQKKGLVYGIDTNLEVRSKNNLISGQFATRNSSAAEAVAEVKSILAAMAEHGVTTEECTDAKGYILGHFPLQLDRTGNIAAMLFTMQLYHLGPDYMEDRVKLFNRVGCDDINRVAAKLLPPERFLFAIVGGTSDAGAPEMKPAASGGADAR